MATALRTLLDRLKRARAAGVAGLLLTRGQYLAKGQQVALEGRLQTRQWDDSDDKRPWKAEVVASSVEMLSGRRKKDYAAEASADTLVAQAAAFDAEPTARAARLRRAPAATVGSA